MATDKTDPKITDKQKGLINYHITEMVAAGRSDEDITAWVAKAKKNPTQAVHEVRDIHGLKANVFMEATDRGFRRYIDDDEPDVEYITKEDRLLQKRNESRSQYNKILLAPKSEEELVDLGFNKKQVKDITKKYSGDVDQWYRETDDKVSPFSSVLMAIGNENAQRAQYNIDQNAPASEVVKAFYRDHHGDSVSERMSMQASDSLKGKGGLAGAGFNDVMKVYRDLEDNDPNISKGIEAYDELKAEKARKREAAYQDKLRRIRSSVSNQPVPTYDYTPTNTYKPAQMKHINSEKIETLTPGSSSYDSYNKGGKNIDVKTQYTGQKTGQTIRGGSYNSGEIVDQYTGVGSGYKVDGLGNVVDKYTNQKSGVKIKDGKVVDQYTNQVKSLPKRKN